METRETIIMAIQALSILMPALILAAYIYMKISKSKELKSYKERMMGLSPEMRQFELVRLQGSLSEYKTNHILHFLISVFTGSLWVPVWIVIAFLARGHKKNIMKYIASV